MSTNPKATHNGELKIGNQIIPCAVLEDGTRLLTQAGVLRAIGRHAQPQSKSGQSSLRPAFLRAGNLDPYISAELDRQLRPIIFRPKAGGGRGGNLAYGYRAEVLPEVCEVFLQARDDGALLPRQKAYATQCEILMRGLATVGIVALVDEATGYQEVRDRKALEEILSKFIASELLPWAKQFPDEFYVELFRLRGWQHLQSPLTGKRPSVVGHYTNDLIYQRLAPAVLDELKARNPVVSGRRRHKHHQWLSKDVGHPSLQEHLTKIVVLMKAAPNWTSFYRSVERALPKLGSTIEMPLTYPSEELDTPKSAKKQSRGKKAKTS